ncbi:MAG: DUF1203 domain-containing protein [Rudaea sp.]
MGFRITGLAEGQFASLFQMTDDELARHGAVRRVADRSPGFPCRISLTDAAIGDDVWLINFEHLPEASPYRSRHAIYVRRGETRCDVIDDVPSMLRSRLLSIRAFDEKGMMVAADVVDGRELERCIETMFEHADARYLHVHFAKPGCYAARVDRH